MESSMSVTDHLRIFREKNDEGTWRAEVVRLAKEAIPHGPKHLAWWRDFTKDMAWLDFDKLVAEAGQAPPTPQQQIDDLLKKQMPGLKTQAQYNVALGALDAVRMTLNAIFEDNTDQEVRGREALRIALELARTSTEIARKLSDVPEAATGKLAEEHKNPPAQFHEFDTQRRLLAELESIQTVEALNEWYASTKQRRDAVVTQSLRNVLMDAIRTKKGTLA
jgi:hypothetical protein